MTLLKRTVTFFIGAASLSAPQSVTGQEPDYEADLAALVALPSVARALELVEERDARTMADLLELTEIAAPPFKEDQRGERFLEMLLDLGVDSAWTDAEGNVLALRRGNGSDDVAKTDRESTPSSRSMALDISGSRTRGLAHIDIKSLSEGLVDIRGGPLDFQIQLTRSGVRSTTSISPQTQSHGRVRGRVIT